jgi:hypothetical protein
MYVFVNSHFVENHHDTHYFMMSVLQQLFTELRHHLRLLCLPPAVDACSDSDASS